MSFNGKTISQEKDLPKDPHWAIITIESMWIEGDERSRTNPGHGYPGHTESYVRYRAFTDEDEWKREIAELTTPKYGSPKPFTAAYVTPAKVTTTVNVKVDIK
jgi:hypothetical protein